MTTSSFLFKAFVIALAAAGVQQPQAPTTPVIPPSAADFVVVAKGQARNWPAFRGPSASGVGDGQGAVVEWDVTTGKNVLWKTPIPGLANSSPITGQK